MKEAMFLLQVFLFITTTTFTTPKIDRKKTYQFPYIYQWIPPISQSILLYYNLEKNDRYDTKTSLGLRCINISLQFLSVTCLGKLGKVKCVLKTRGFDRDRNSSTLAYSILALAFPFLSYSAFPCSNIFVISDNQWLPVNRHRKCTYYLTI